AAGACPKCGRVVSAPKTASGVRTVHIPPPFLPMLQKHLLEHTAAGPTGLLFPGDRADHMSVRYLMDRYRPARTAAGRPDLTIHHLRHTALTMAGQHGATAAELQARAGHASQAAMAIYQHATADRDRTLAEQIGQTYTAWLDGRSP
ncbi:MAG TPA: tyrosine-type recombinase/integrase, partial [Nocardioides sp.]|nr:tyrosine-type recombinase/integrase [Nocardioides sp.]